MSKITNKSKYSGIFQYFDEGFYEFLTLVEHTKIPKRIRFKSKNIITITDSQAAKIKIFIHNSGLKYKTRQLTKLLLQHPAQIQNIINRSTYVN